jgi:hypothetical protein
MWIAICIRRGAGRGARGGGGWAGGAAVGPGSHLISSPMGLGTGEEGEERRRGSANRDSWHTGKLGICGFAVLALCLLQITFLGRKPF